MQADTGTYSNSLPEKQKEANNPKKQKVLASIFPPLRMVLFSNFNKGRLIFAHYNGSFL
jgi:hypothetical protein